MESLGCGGCAGQLLMVIMSMLSQDLQDTEAQMGRGCKRFIGGNPVKSIDEETGVGGAGFRPQYRSDPMEGGAEGRGTG